MKKRLFFIISFICLVATSNLLYGESDRYFLHTVSKGEGLYSISRMYNVTQEEIISLNPGSEKVIKIGQELKIPHKNRSNMEQRFHTVKEGETLYRLSVENRVSVKNICDANPGLTIENFKAGEVIVIPAPTDKNPIELTNETEQRILSSTELQNSILGRSSTESSYKTTHKVKRKETIYRICKNYNISQADLIEANPNLRYSKLAVGDILNIPFTKEELNAKQKKEMESIAEIDKTIDDETLFALHETESQNLERIKAALILPFELSDSATTEQKKMVEFYQGVLMALEELKQESISIELVVLDSQGEDESIVPLLNSPKMEGVNIIFGPKYPKHIDEAADFSLSHHIPLVLPISSNVDKLYNNPYIFQLNTPQSYLYQEIYDHFTRQFSNANVIVLNDGSFTKNEFIDGLMTHLDNLGLPHITMAIDTAAQQFVDTLEATRQNIFIINSSSSAPLIDMLPVLQLINRMKPAGVETHLFGYPEYQIYAANHLEEFYEIDTYFYSWFYTNNTLDNAANFHSRFQRAFSRQMMISYPSFATYGYDMAYYFLKGLSTYGTQFTDHLDQIATQPIQMGFKFDRINNWGGFINKKIFFVHLSNDYRVTKIDYDR